jgi:hypothetical protein
MTVGPSIPDQAPSVTDRLASIARHARDVLYQVELIIQQLRQDEENPER